MDDQEVLGRINSLAAEEHDLWQREGKGEQLNPDERRRMEQLQVRLDQCWDLLHQRRALRNAGMNPDEAVVRAPDVVENYTE